MHFPLKHDFLMNSAYIWLRLAATKWNPTGFSAPNLCRRTIKVDVTVPVFWALDTTALKLNKKLCLLLPSVFSND